ncbi:MAG TPA: peptidylprolyl isomerase [Candidatus Kapabacteria bacterium]|nr:peptidylprolyl isomerase [Candidatus Kapabacteria bacterium]
MRSSRIYRSIAIWTSAVAVVGSVTVASLDAQSVKGSKKTAKTEPKSATVTGKSSGGVVLKTSFGDVPVSEFEAAFRRMNAKDPYATTKDSLLEFLDVYTDYRLKLQDAKESGLFDDPKVKTEIAGYREMLAGPFILEKELVDPIVASIYEKRKYEIEASHFLAKMANPNDPADTLKAYNKAMRALKMLNDNMPMSLVVMNSSNNAILANGDREVLDREKQIDPKKYTDGETWEGTDDKGTQNNGGKLGYFTGGMTVRAFEDAAFSLAPGSYTQAPVRSKFGYHLIQVYDRIPRVGGVKVSHILIKVSKMAEDTSREYAKADSLYKLLLAGADFAKLAKENTDDPDTKERGGDMDYINREDRRTPPEFDMTAYRMKDGELSPPIRTAAGYHIIRRNGTVPLPSFEAERDKLKQLYKRYYFEDDKKEFVQGLQKKYNLKVDTSTFSYFLGRIDTTRTSLDSTWDARITAQDRERVIFSIKDEKFTLGALVDSLNADEGAPLARIPLLDNITKTTYQHALRIGARDLLPKHPDFETMMQDYQNGIILFELENQRVWSKAVPDSAGVRKYYDQNKSKFLFPERVDVSEIFVLSDSLAKQLYKRIMAGENFDSLAKKYTERPGFKDKAGRWGLLQKDENEISKRAFTFVAEEIKEPFRFQAGYSIVRMNKRVPATQKTFDEARQEVGSQYQEAKSQELRKAWVEGLRRKYNRQVNKDILLANWKKHNSDKAAK